jgi:hypothetical protein
LLKRQVKNHSSTSLLQDHDTHTPSTYSHNTGGCGQLCVFIHSYATSKNTAMYPPPQ